MYKKRRTSDILGCVSLWRQGNRQLDLCKTPEFTKLFAFPVLAITQENSSSKKKQHF
jgi:hypothetical protein